jgi:AraC family transcriptional regulator of adaptative response/methylated-DNA-[protein]-cysteine methyltransferase
MGQLNYNAVTKAIEYLIVHAKDRPDLYRLGSRFNVDPLHFPKMFEEHVGVSPKRITEFLNFTRGKDFNLDIYPSLEAAYHAGLASAGRVPNFYVSCETAPPEKVLRRGEGLTITYGYHVSPLGDILVAQTDIGLCWMGFVVNDDRSIPFTEMKSHWPKARLIADTDATKKVADHAIRIWQGRGDSNNRLTIDLHGTIFQVQVWRALLKIPLGAVVSYQDIAEAISLPTASRAVGAAIGYNPVSLLIPCHRVIQKSGMIENYLWGSARKKIILGLESDTWIEKEKINSLNVI